MTKIYWNNLDPEVAQQIKDSFAGILTPDGTTITVDGNGVISAIAGEAYELPTASTTVLGGVKVDGTTITINANGVITAIQGTPISVINDLTTGGATDALSAEMGKDLKALIDSLTTGLADKINKTDIVNDLTTGGTQKVLSAEMGKDLKAEVDGNKDRLDTLDQDLLQATESITTHIAKKATKDDAGHVTVDDTTIRAVNGQLQVINPFTSTEKDKLANIEAEANKYVLPVASTTVLGGIKQGTGMTIEADGTTNINFPVTTQPQFGEFTTVTTVDGVRDFIYTPVVPLKPEDTAANLIVVYNTTTLKSTDFSIEEVGGVRVIVLNVEEADTVAKNDVSGFILRGFAPLS